MVTARTPVWSLSAPRLLSPARLLPGTPVRWLRCREARGAWGALVATAGERRYCTPALGGSGGFRHLPTGHRGAPGRGRANGQDSSRPAPRGGNSHRTASRSCLAHIHPSPAAFRRIGTHRTRSPPRPPTPRIPAARCPCLLLGPSSRVTSSGETTLTTASLIAHSSHYTTCHHTAYLFMFSFRVSGM